MELVDGRSLTYRQIDTAKSGAYREQVRDDQPASGQPGFPPGEGTLSATPLAWSHAQFVRLAWSIDAGHPVEQPPIVACRHVRTC